MSSSCVIPEFFDILFMETRGLPLNTGSVTAWSVAHVENNSVSRSVFKELSSSFPVFLRHSLLGCSHHSLSKIVLGFWFFFFEITIFIYQLDKYQEVRPSTRKDTQSGKVNHNFYGSLICQYLSKFKSQISHTSYSIHKVVICRNKNLKQIKFPSIGD